MRILRVLKKPTIEVLDYYTEIQSGGKNWGSYFWMEYPLEPGYIFGLYSIVYIAGDGDRAGSALSYRPGHLISIKMERL